MKAKPKENESLGKNAVEWAVFAGSALLLVGVIAVLLMEALRWQDTPARVKVELGAAERRGDGWCVPVVVSNEGEGLASNVEIEVSDGGEERAGLTLDFVPRGTKREGKVCFPAEVDPGKLRGRVLGYEER